MLKTDYLFCCFEKKKLFRIISVIREVLLIQYYLLIKAEFDKKLLFYILISKITILLTNSKHNE